MSVLKLDRVTVLRRGRKVLDGNSATFQAHRVTAVIGPNGAGKSTMLNAAAGLLQPDAGRVTLDGADISRLHRRELARRRAYLPQRADVDWPITVERVVALGLVPQLPAFGPLPSAFCPPSKGRWHRATSGICGNAPPMRCRAGSSRASCWPAPS
ncbi:ATP-binding cassette domain-containing protein [Novosphingobium panipatense]